MGLDELAAKKLALLAARNTLGHAEANRLIWHLAKPFGPQFRDGPSRWIMANVQESEWYLENVHQVDLDIQRMRDERAWADDPREVHPQESATDLATAMQEEAAAAAASVAAGGASVAAEGTSVAAQGASTDPRQWLDQPHTSGSS